MKTEDVKRPGEALQPNPEHTQLLTAAVSSWFVRKDSKFFEVENITTKLSKDDVQRVCLHRFAEEFPEIPLDNIPLGEVFRRSIDLQHSAPGQTIPVGAHIIAPEGAAAAMALKMGMTYDDLGAMIFPYLTTVEGLKLAAQTFEKDVAKLSCCAGYLIHLPSCPSKPSIMNPDAEGSLTRRAHRLVASFQVF